MVKTNYIEICLKEYLNALQKSLFDSDWVENLYKDKINIFEFFEKVGKNNTIRNAVKFLETNRINYVFESCDKNILNQNVVDMVFDAGTAEQNKKMIMSLYEQTHYYANIVACLINEYSENKREFFDIKIKPMPESIQETWRPITKFKVGETLVEVTNSGLNVMEKGNLHNYFEARKKNKVIKKLYLPESLLSSSDFQAVKRKLLHFKECEINSNYAMTENLNAKYKITLYGSQTVKNDNFEYNIVGKNIKVLHICEV